MGHIQLGKLAKSRKWQDVVSLLGAGASAEVIAAATAKAAESEFAASANDPALIYTVWLLSQLPLAARSDHYHERLAELGFSEGSGDSLPGLISSLADAVDSHVAGKNDRTDLGVMAQMAATESLSNIIGDRLPTLFGLRAGDIQAELARLGTTKQFAVLARDFFSRLTQKTLEYYLSRELPNHVGPGKSLQSLDQEFTFRQALETHCRESSLIVETFSGGWFSKANYQGGITPEKAAGYTSFALTKMRKELQKRRRQDD